ncbi:MAG: DUF4288 domain-containing protein [Nitrosopumilaceae archaeon]|nr:DUF4288 domain-containing protein [Nitrosopumilaceae archaeon]NIV66181.1 DUF4288 domain-containing protein [Nitrosopumilaceae archaeon]NIX61056.1 DUF4288 domain-containing protein [Nitrosopumilaceae archaeon]
MFYSVCILLKSIHSIPSDDEPLWEERIVLVEAVSEEEAQKKGENIGKNSEETYEAQKGDIVSWKFIKVQSICSIDEENIKDGTELFSRFLKDSEARSLLTPFDD